MLTFDVASLSTYTFVVMSKKLLSYPLSQSFALLFSQEFYSFSSCLLVFDLVGVMFVHGKVRRDHLCAVWRFPFPSRRVLSLGSVPSTAERVKTPNFVLQDHSYVQNPLRYI